MRRLAGIFLGSGLFFIALVVGLALSTVMEYDALASPLPDTTDNCLFCHVNVHTPWQMVTAVPSFNLPETPAPSSIYIDADSQLCSDCHSIDNQFDLPGQEIRARIDDIQARVAALQAAVDDLFETHSEWDADANRQQKPDNQIIAERISTLIGVVRADGSWGFHDPDYTESILVEAESLLALLLEDSTRQ